MPATTTDKRRGVEMNLAGDVGEILIYGEIGYYASNYFLEQLAQLRTARVLDIRINSPGGLASEGIAIYQALARHQAVKNVYIDAACYSAAGIIALAASPGKLRMAFNARFMMHEALNEAFGNKREMRKVGDILEMLDRNIAATFAKRMKGHTTEQILELLEAETWYDAEGAMEVGIVDEIFDGTQEEPDDAINMLRGFKHPPADLVTRLTEKAQAAPPSADAIDVAARWAQVRGRNAA